MGADSRRWQWIVPWLFLAPALVVFTWFKFVPVVKGLVMSFYKIKFTGADQWVGLANFQRMLSDTALHAATAHTFIYVISSTIAGGILSFAVALLLDKPATHIKIIRTAIFFPAVTSVAVLAEIWRIIFYPAAGGVVNSILGLFGAGPYGWMSDPNQALFTVILLQIWKSVPYNMVIFIAGLAGINRELYDAADVDGAGPWSKMWHVTIPGLIPAFSVVIMLSFIRGFRVFTEVYTTTGGGPSGRTSMIMTHIFTAGFERLDYGYAAAISFVLFAFTVLLTVAHVFIKNKIARF
ncbi:Binding-protein-dependent transport systems inner membrane component [uncultured Pleomorphomonas sp.]|uniref:Sugar ABC transporter permease n=2 Tax=Pleomorphomonas TaxID=261933 RepID=A0A2G9X019_9HYPH|nr:sugar ABC transporter permease [Pleomorphomonas carboxyditropha]PIP00275.1 sugar ABC transporter permease [Pleomorphomonas carboxyditropha]SCM76123.1 Binding-protein-dependent transport systems inner membrane component [uncultured Pleomorphomonas sp.]